MRVAKRLAVLSTSSAADIKCGAGVVRINGLTPFRAKDIVAFTQYKSRDEVQQVVKIDGTAYTIEAGVTYLIEMVSDAFKQQGNEASKSKFYKYTTPATLTDIGANANAQKETVHGELIKQINADTIWSFVSATSLGGGAGITITDKPGYDPAFTGGNYNTYRRGPTIVIAAKDKNGKGWVDSLVNSVTTKAVLSSGDGTKLVQLTPQVNQVTGNNTKGDMIYANAVFVANQKYDIFEYTTLNEAPIPTATSLTAYQLHCQAVFVDNGTGNDTTNVGGHSTFEKEAIRIGMSVYESDSASVLEFFDNPPVFGTVTVASTSLPSANGLPTGATGDINVISVGKNSFNYSIIGTATQIVPTWGAPGLTLNFDATTNDGVELSTPMTSNKELISGKTDIVLNARIYLTLPIAANALIIGLRQKVAYNSSAGGSSNYANVAGLGFDTSTTPQPIKMINSNGLATFTRVTTGQLWTSASYRDLEVRISAADRTVRYFVNGVEYTSAFTAAGSVAKVDNNIFIVPFIYLNLAQNALPGLKIERFYFGSTPFRA